VNLAPIAFANGVLVDAQAGEWQRADETS